jgi:hypothetical protein
MLHPNELAIEYIWERFSETYFAAETKTILSELYLLQQAIAHRPLFPGSTSTQGFREELEKKKESFTRKYPFIPL